MKSYFFLSMLFLPLILLGWGCSFQEKILPAVEPQQTQSPQEVAESLDFKKDSSFVMEQTVFGFGGSTADALGRKEGKRSILIENFVPKESVAFSWTLEKNVETSASKKAREEYEELKRSTPIGESLPEEPEVEYGTVTSTGSLGSEALVDGTVLYPPPFWKEGEEGIVDEKTVIWLSAKQYDELVNTRSTTISLGIFDEKLSSLQSFGRIFDRAKKFIQQAPQAEQTQEDLYKVEADGEWGEYTLMVNGEQKTVRTTRASNWFGSYIILANPENPLILEMHLNPLSFGSLKEGVTEAFSGYQVIEVND